MAENIVEERLVGKRSQRSHVGVLPPLADLFRAWMLETPEKRRKGRRISPRVALSRRWGVSGRVWIADPCESDAMLCSDVDRSDQGYPRWATLPSLENTTTIDRTTGSSRPPTPNGLSRNPGPSARHRLAHPAIRVPMFPTWSIQQVGEPARTSEVDCALPFHAGAVRGPSRR